MLLAVSAAAQTPRGHVVTRTRLVALYSDLERQVGTAAQNQDQARLGQLLADDFEQWGPEPPGDPVPREEWTTTYRPSSFSTRQMAVRAFSDVDVVSFVLRQKATVGEKDSNGDFFVVDVWRHEGNTAKLSARYISKAVENHAPPASPSVKR